jgi:hypothetical protein
MDVNYCTGAKSSVYNGSVAECISACNAGFPYVAGAQNGDGGLAFDLVDENAVPWESGDTLNCRLWHLEKAIVTDAPATHCPHTDQNGGGMCTGPHP